MRKGRSEKIILKGVLWVVALLLVIFTIFILGSTWDVWQKQQKAFKERENAREKYEEVKGRAVMLASELERLSSDRGLEEEFRKRFPVAREGEEVFILVDTENSTVEPSQTQEQGFWAAIGAWLGF